MAKSITKMNKQEFQEWLMSDPEVNLKKLYTKKYINSIKWSYVPIKLVRKYKSLINWIQVSKRNGLSEFFIAKHKDLVDWYYISEYQQLSEAFIERHKNLVKWTCISRCQQLSEDFIEKYKDFVSRYYISMYQHLSESFIEKHKDLVSWNMVSRYQSLSEPFIEKYKDLVVWYNISRCQQLSEAFVETHKTELNMFLVNNNWLNKDTEFKKKAVIDTGLYECHEDYFIAYKGIRSDRYSAFNFQYKYLPGNTYTCFADGSEDENSFGLSVWNESNARDYCPKLVVKCKVFYEDVARVVHNGGKIRCSKITILD